MTPVSYVSPTYYADRLCERGRLYIRKYFNGDDKTLWNDLNDFKTKFEADLRTDKEKQFDKSQYRKEKSEKDMEKAHAEKIAKETKMFVFKKVAKEFYRDWDEEEPEKSAGNPWADSIADTMFWM
jgi:eukaryotic translation initiation factor 2C